MDTSCLHPRDEILQLMERIYSYRMTTTSGGNLSLREDNGDVWITPARVDKGGLRRDDIVCVRADGGVEGTRPPSSELPLHQAVYRARPDVQGIVHAHPVALVAFSLAHQVPDTRLFHQARHVCGEGGFAPYELPGSEALGRNVASAFANGPNSVILENHGVVTAGTTLQEAFQRFETFEFTGKTLIKARQIGDVRFLSDERIELPQRTHRPLPEFERGPLSSAEKELRQRLCDFVRRSYRQRLFISTWGTISARLDERSFVITPYQADRAAIQPAELVLVYDGAAEAGSTPSRAAALHRAIYRRHSAVGAIISGYPVNATAFSVTGAEFDTRTIPESFVVVRQAGRAPYGLQFEHPEAIADMISAGQPALILDNDGVLVTGSGILEAFDRLEVLESTAEAIINCRAVGALTPMPDDAIRELEDAFFRR